MKGLFTTLITMGLLFVSVNALTLEKAVDEALATNPIVLERLKNYRMVVEDLNVAEAGYLPDVDWKTKNRICGPLQTRRYRERLGLLYVYSLFNLNSKYL